MTTEELAYLLQVITTQQRLIDSLNATVKTQTQTINELEEAAEND